MFVCLFVFSTRRRSLRVEMNVQSAGEITISTEQVQKLVVSLKNSEVYLSTDIKFVNVITRDST